MILFSVAIQSACISAVVANLFTPHRLDTGDLALRAINLNSIGSYIAGESIEHTRVAVLLHNRSTVPQDYYAFQYSKQILDLGISITHSNGRGLRAGGDRGDQHDPNQPKLKLPVGGWAGCPFRLASFGFGSPLEVGTYRIDVSLLNQGKTYLAPPIKFEVVEITRDCILVSHKLPLEGKMAERSINKQERAIIQQIALGKKVWLFYSQFASPENGGKAYSTTRLTELPGKCEMRVEGSFGDNNPLTISYKDAPYMKFYNKQLVINSVDGYPWTASKEKHRQEKLKRGGQPAPPPEKK